jgi:Tfp pilus assembly protein PilN
MEQQVNLYQPIMRAEKRLFSASAIALGVLVLLACLGALAGFAAWRTASVETTVADIEKQEAARLASLEQASAAIGGETTLPELEAQIAEIAARVAARERALALVGRDGSATRGFAARLDALAAPALDGLWLRRIVLDPARGGLALSGATRDPSLVPRFLAALQADRSFTGESFGSFELRLARPEETPAAAVFTVAAPALAQLLRDDAGERGR